MTAAVYTIASELTCYSASPDGESSAQPVGVRRLPSSILEITGYSC